MIKNQLKNSSEMGIEKVKMVVCLSSEYAIALALKKYI